MKERLFDIFERVLEIDRNDISFDMKIKDIPQWDSLANILITSEIQEVFDKKIPIKKFDELETVGDFIEFVNNI